MKKGKEKLKEVEEKLDKLRNLRRPILKRIKELEKIKEVEEYKKVLEENKEYEYKINKIEEEFLVLKQEICKHNLWYYLGDITDSYEMRQTWICICIECGIEYEERSREFSNVIKDSSESIPYIGYLKAKKKYEQLCDLNLSEEEIIETMLSFYDNEKVKERKRL